MSTTVIFGGHVSGKGTNANHGLRIKVTYDFNSIRYYECIQSPSSISPLGVFDLIDSYR